MRRSASASARPAPSARRAATTSRWARAASLKSPASSAWRRVLLDHREALGVALALGPELERLQPEARRVAVRVDGHAPVDRLEERIQRARDVARGQPVGRDLGGVVAAVGEEGLGEAAVQGPPPQPRHVLIDRLARQRLAEPRAPRLGLDQAPVGQQLGDALLVLHVGDEVEVDDRARHRRDLRRGPRRLRHLGQVDEHRVADRLGQGHVEVEVEIGAVGRVAQAVTRAQRGGELLDEERHAAGPVVQRAGQPRRRCGAEDARHERGGLVRGQRLERELLQGALAAQVVAQPAQRMGAGSSSER